MASSDSAGKNNDKLGAALVRGDGRELLHLLIGDPLPGIDDRMTLAARTAFDASEFEEAMKNWPRRCGMERRILHRFIKTRRPAASARAVDQKIRRLWVSALQSRMFNDVAAARIDTIDQIMTGDVAYKEDNGACFWLPTRPSNSQDVPRLRLARPGRWLATG